MFEIPATTSENPKKEVLDAGWYERFEKIGSFQAYEYLDGDKQHRNLERDRFLTGEKENPTLDYPRLDREKIDSIEEELLILKTDILEQEENSVVRQVYRWRINEKLAEIRLLRASADGDMRRFRKYSEFIYGKPSPEIFAYTIKNVRKNLIDGTKSENQDIRVLAEELLAELSIEQTQHPIPLPATEVIQAAKDITEKTFSDLIDIPASANEILDAESIKALFSNALTSIQADGWTAQISTDSKSGISVNQESRQVVIPESRKSTVGNIRKLIAHEVGTHALRRINGEQTKLRLLGLGLDRYESGEEGIATMREQALEGDVTDFSGFDGHLAISLAEGLDRNPRNFRDVFTILEKYYRFRHLSNGEGAEDAIKKAGLSAWNRCIRTFRGTDCSTHGTCFTKDIVYREGNIAIWDVISKNAPEMMRFDIGKYDPSNPRHIWVLEQLNITDDDLINLEKIND